MSQPPLDLPDLARQHRRLQRLVVALVGDEHGAEDVVQDAWLRALQHGPREPRALGAWLGTVTRRLASNVRRGQRRRHEREEDAARAEALPSSQEIAPRLELEARVLALVDALEEPHRTVLRDRYLGELTPMEIARRDGVPLDTVKARLARARAELRAKLERAGFGRDVHWTAAIAPLLVARDAWHLVPAAEAANLTASLTPLSGATALGLPELGASALGSAFVMKKLILAGVALVVGLATWRVLQPPSTALVERPLVSADGAAPSAALVPAAMDLDDAERAPLADSAPFGARSASPTPVAGSAPVWIVQGRARRAGSGGAAPFAGLEIELALYDGYTPEGEPWHRATVVSGADGSFSLALDDPLRTVVLTVKAEDNGERAVVTYGPYVSVRDEAPPGPVDALVFPRDARIVGRVLDERDQPVHACRVAGLYGAAETDHAGCYELTIASSAWGGLTATASGFGEELKEFEGLQLGSETTVDFVLRPGGVFEGIVRDEQGIPLAGVQVATMSMSRRSVTTDRSGRYKLDWLRLVEGDWVSITVEAEGYVRIHYGFEIPADTAQFTHDFVLERGAVVSGRVVDPAGTPVRGARVWLGYGRHAWNLCEGHADDQGRFVFQHAPVGASLMGAEKAGFAGASITVEVSRDDGARDLVIALGRTRILRGTVQDEHGEPLAGVSVSARSGQEYVGERGLSDASGAFEVVDLPAGRLTIEAFARGLVRTELQLTEDQTEVDVSMRRAGALRGRVVDASTGEPVPFFTVRFVRPDDLTVQPMVSGYSSSWSDPGKTFVSPEGTWATDEFDELQPGAWIGVEVTAPGYAPRLIGLVRVAGPEDDAELVHELLRPVEVECSVVFRGNGQPVADAALLAGSTRRLGEEDPRWSARSDAAGLAVLTDVAPGPLYVRVSRAGRVPIILGPYEVPGSGRRGVVVVEVPGGATVDVTLMDEHGAPVPGRTVTLTTQDVAGLAGDERVSAVTDHAGRARFEDVLPGRWQVARLIRDGEHETQDLWRTLEVPADLADVECELRAPGSTVLRGTVECALALPDDLVVSVLARDGGPSHAAFVRAGRFEVRGLALGSYLVSATFWEQVSDRTAMGLAELIIEPNEREVEVALTLVPRS